MLRFPIKIIVFALSLLSVFTCGIPVIFAQNIVIGSSPQDTGILGNTSSGISNLSGDVDLIVEPSSYTPPFYSGRASFSNQGSAKVVAIPNINDNGSAVSANDLIFKWTRNDIVLGDSNGLGKNSLIVTGSVPIDSINIKVDISDKNGNLVTSKSVNLTPGNPKILFYENNALYGILFNKAVLGDYNLGNREELKITAEPFFFDSKTPTSQLSYEWSVNGQTVNLDGKKNEILLRQENKNMVGTTLVSLQTNNLARIFQYTGESLNINFGE
jgi:hypothetical protein